MVDDLFALYRICAKKIRPKKMYFASQFGVQVQSGSIALKKIFARAVASECLPSAENASTP